MQSNFKQFVKLSGMHQFGIIALILLIIFLQLLINYVADSPSFSLSNRAKQWLKSQQKVDSIRSAIAQVEKSKVWTFNPNFIDDVKGYHLGMSAHEIDRLLTFRKTGRYVNSEKDFQQVTKVSDSLLAVLAPQFKFPDWVKEKGPAHFVKTSMDNKPQPTLLDINSATEDELIGIYGIGPGFAARVITLRSQLGGFLLMEQMQDVYGLPQEVITALNKKYKVVGVPTVKKININTATLAELAKFPYFRYALAREIVTFRTMQGTIKNLGELEKIKNFPTNRLHIISLYLEL